MSSQKRRLEESGLVEGLMDITSNESKCPCGDGTVDVFEDNTPGFREHDVYIRCDKCREKYKVDKSDGYRNWKLVEK